MQLDTNPFATIVLISFDFMPTIFMFGFEKYLEKSY